MQKEVVNGKFGKALLWNYFSIVVMAVSGLLMNAVIALFYGSAVLGAFSETYAWYVILSQLSVWGIHVAIVKYVPEAGSEEEKGAILKNAVIITLMTSLIITMFSEIVVFFVYDVEWKSYMKVAFSGLVLLSINKVLLNYLNAVYKMVVYAVFTSIRYAVFGGGILLLAFIGAKPDYLALIFPFTELVVFGGMAGYFLFRIRVFGKPTWRMFNTLLCFGTKILPSYMVLEMNTKVDVVCLGILISNVSQIGIYSFSIFFTEGFYLLYITIRKIINPRIAAANAEGKLLDQITKIKIGIRRYMVVGSCMAYLGIAGGYVLLCCVMQRPEYVEGLIYLLIICLSIVLNGKYIVFGDLLAQIGYPLEESMLNVLTVAGNFVLNIIFIMLLGKIGAAVATAVSYFIFSFYMKVRVKERSGIIL